MVHFTSMHVCACAHACLHMCACMCACLLACVCVCACLFACMCMSVNVYTCMSVVCEGLSECTVGCAWCGRLHRSSTTLGVLLWSATAGLLKSSSKDHYTCQLCYSRFERMAGTLAGLHQELRLPSAAASTGRESSGRLVAVDRARTAVNKILRLLDTHSEEKVEIEA